MFTRQLHTQEHHLQKQPEICLKVKCNDITDGACNIKTDRQKWHILRLASTAETKIVREQVLSDTEVWLGKLTGPAEHAIHSLPTHRSDFRPFILVPWLLQQ